jgi:signal transduction histidine kinase
MITLADQVSQGVSDAALSSDVRALNELALAKEQASQQRALLNYSFTAQTTSAYGNGNKSVVVVDENTEQALTVAYHQEFVDEAGFQQAATPAELAFFAGSQSAPKAVGVVEDIEQSVFTLNNSDPAFPGVVGSPLLNSVQGTITLGTNAALIPIGGTATFVTTGKGAGVVTTATAHDGIKSITGGQTAWQTGMGAKLTAMQGTENMVAGNIASRASQLQSSAQQSALVFAVITVAVLLVVLLAALLVARSLVLPLRRLRAGALDIASVQLPERVRLLSESPESAASMEVAPIDVATHDEIGQVARAFDQVHSEAVRLAGEQAILRSSFNAMFVNLSRRSQTLIERLARMIDNLEQNEDDPDRLGSLFSMDHLVTRMRRNSENLLLLAGHENPRKWSDAVPLADIARAATSEIEQYNRVVLNIPPGVSVIGQAVSDVVHLLAELVENATIFSPKDTQVQVSTQELTSGGVLIEIIDKGIGVSEARLTDMNWRLDNPPTIDVSVSRHMGLFAVARLAERHRVRVRLRPAPPQGLSALVWLPDSVIERAGGRGLGSGTSSRSAQPVWSRTRAVAGEAAALTATGSVLTATGQGGPGNGYANGNGVHGNSALEGRTASGWFRGGRDGADQALAGTMGGQDAGFGADFGAGTDLAGAFGGSSGTGQTASGLPVRVPRSSTPPGAGGAGTSDGQTGLPARTAGNGRPQGTGPRPAKGGMALPQRSPEQARSRLAGFQRGTRRAEGQGGSGGQAPRAGEGTLS